MKTETQYLEPVEWDFAKLFYCVNTRTKKLCEYHSSGSITFTTNPNHASFAIQGAWEDRVRRRPDASDYKVFQFGNEPALAKALQDMIEVCKQMMKDDDITNVLAAMGKHELMKQFAANYENAKQVLKDAGLTDKL